jgi:hypothetical protein
MTKSAHDAYQKGYTDGVVMAEKMRWRGTPLGNFLQGVPYRPEANHRSVYDAGCKRVMEEASRGEWTPPCHESCEQENLGKQSSLAMREKHQGRSVFLLHASAWWGAASSRLRFARPAAGFLLA